MKTVKRILTGLCSAAVILASSFPAFAIGFDAEKTYESVFVVQSGYSEGSGFALGENCIITNAHVIEDPKQIDIITYGGDVYSAFPVSIDQELDIAVLGVPDVKLVPLQVALPDTFSVGDDVCAIGTPINLAFTLTKGVVSSKNRMVGDRPYIQTDAAINSGNSGGPLLTDEGKVIGINSMKITEAEGIGLAIPMDRVLEYMKLEGIETDENGIVKGQVAEPVAAIEETVEEPRVEIVTVTENSPVLIGALIVSVAANIVLLILLLCGKKKKKDPAPLVPADPTERTDFDIEIYG